MQVIKQALSKVALDAPPSSGKWPLIRPSLLESVLLTRRELVSETATVRTGSSAVTHSPSQASWTTISGPTATNARGYNTSKPTCFGSSSGGLQQVASEKEKTGPSRVYHHIWGIEICINLRFNKISLLQATLYNH